MNHFIYILKCVDSSLYTGYTTDIKKRVEEHNASKRGARYTTSRRPVALVYSEKYKTKSKALKREIEIKKWLRKKKLVLIGSRL